MKIFVLIFFIFNIALLNHAQTYVYKFRPLKGKMWGYADITGKTIIEPQFPHCYDFSENGIAVIYYIKWEYADFIRLNGQFIKPELIDFTPNSVMGRAVQGYKCGLIAIQDKNKWGYLNSQGKIAIPLKYKEATLFNENHAIARLDKNFFVLDTLGNETPVNVKDIKLCRNFSEGLAPFLVKDDKFGFIDFKGNIIIEANFLGVGYFNAGKAWARDLNGKIGFIDKTGKWIIEPQFDIALDFDKESGMAQVSKEGNWSYVDTTGKIINFHITEKLVSFSEGMARGVQYGKTGFFDNKGTWVVKPGFEGARDFKNGYAAVKLDGKWGFIDKKGNWVIEPSFSGLGDVIVVK